MLIRLHKNYHLFPALSHQAAGSDRPRSRKAGEGEVIKQPGGIRL